MLTSIPDGNLHFLKTQKNSPTELLESLDSITLL